MNIIKFVAYCNIIKRERFYFFNYMTVSNITKYNKIYLIFSYYIFNLSDIISRPLITNHVHIVSIPQVISDRLEVI